MVDDSRGGSRNSRAGDHAESRDERLNRTACGRDRTCDRRTQIQQSAPASPAAWAFERRSCEEPSEKSSPQGVVRVTSVINHHRVRPER